MYFFIILSFITFFPLETASQPISSLDSNTKTDHIIIDIPCTKETKACDLFLLEIPFQLQKIAQDLNFKSATLSTFEQIQKKYYPNLSPNEINTLKIYYERLKWYEDGKKPYISCTIS